MGFDDYSDAMDAGEQEEAAAAGWVVARTDKAVLIDPTEGCTGQEKDRTWLPISQIIDSKNLSGGPDTLLVGERYRLTIPLWLAEKKGL